MRIRKQFYSFLYMYILYVYIYCIYWYSFMLYISASYCIPFRLLYTYYLGCVSKQILGMNTQVFQHVGDNVVQLVSPSLSQWHEYIKRCPSVLSGRAALFNCTSRYTFNPELYSTSSNKQFNKLLLLWNTSELMRQVHYRHIRRSSSMVFSLFSLLHNPWWLLP